MTEEEKKAAIAEALAKRQAKAHAGKTSNDPVAAALQEKATRKQKGKKTNPSAAAGYDR